MRKVFVLLFILSKQLKAKLSSEDLNLFIVFDNKEDNGSNGTEVFITSNQI